MSRLTGPMVAGWGGVERRSGQERERDRAGLLAASLRTQADILQKHNLVKSLLTHTKYQLLNSN